MSQLVIGSWREVVKGGGGGEGREWGGGSGGEGVEGRGGGSSYHAVALVLGMTHVD